MIGPGGINIQGIERESGAIVNLESAIVILMDQNNKPSYFLQDALPSWAQRAKNSKADYGHIVNGYTPFYIFGNPESTQLAMSMVNSILKASITNSRGKKRNKGGKKRRSSKRREAYFALLRKRFGEKVFITRETHPGDLSKKLKLHSEMLVETLSKMGEHGYGADTIMRVIWLITYIRVWHGSSVSGGGELEIGRSERIVTDKTPGRPAVITIMGHVDHGKTTLLDALRKSSIGDTETGGITQKIGGFTIKDKKEVKLTFIDTPGHAAFSSMRKTGSSASDINVIVIDAEDGIMPQTREALEIAKQSQEEDGMPFVVAITKIDRDSVDVQECTKNIEGQLLENGVTTESMGGDVQVVPLSAVSGKGLDDLIDAISLLADLLELKSEPKAPAEGIILESSFERGSGVVADLLVQWGTLKKNDYIVWVRMGWLKGSRTTMAKF